MRPFNNLIVPERFHDLSLRNLFTNQNKLVTGYDLYNTLRSLLTPKLKNGSNAIKNEKNFLNGVPEWSLNLLKENVPDDRTCEDAKVPVEFCPCVEERNDLMPYYYVGHAEKLDEIENEELLSEVLGIMKPNALSGSNTSLTKNGMVIISQNKKLAHYLGSKQAKRSTNK